eukprot:6534863-Pyramimonas_sp.AAC.1
MSGFDCEFPFQRSLPSLAYDDSFAMRSRRDSFAMRCRAGVRSSSNWKNFDKGFVLFSSSPHHLHSAHYCRIPCSCISLHRTLSEIPKQRSCQSLTGIPAILLTTLLHCGVRLPLSRVIRPDGLL